ncbi:DUF4012 domain-containing protein [Humibacter sp. RRB41]|uniref:DUF4012 domain-containing protein n=1 Tax=Humibacter sp. RRB41 TaxID=2919946 RepID=UPI001FAA2FA1|nr:DUF4012 domain-containing protein [Humibacter sp. RRB41]
MRATVGWLIGGFVVALVCFGVYLGMLVFDVQHQLQASATDLSKLQSSFVSGDASHALGEAKTAASDVTAATHRARGDANNSLWRAAEAVPLLGPNLVAARKASDVMADAADGAVTPLATLAGRLSPADFTPKQHHVDTGVLAAAATTLSKASGALGTASERADAIDVGGTMPDVRDAITTLRAQLGKAAVTADAVQRAARLLPQMLGSTGPRNYLLLFQNNAELRSTGGIPGALAVVHVDHGTITMTQQASSNTFPAAADATRLLPKSTLALYGELPGRYIQDVTLPPQFDLSGSLARALWQQTTGQQVDGVISVDPIALSYLLKATGPVTLPTGEVLAAGNAVKVLLSDSYAKYPVDQQNAFFADAATAVFQAATDGAANTGAMLPALMRAGAEGRILVWSAHADEQKQLAETSLAGGLPASSEKDPTFGIYLNDATGAKMDYYLRAKVATGRAMCRADGKANLAVAVTLTNAAPENAATSLPSYVTGGGQFGVKPGDIATQIAVYGPARSAWLGTTVDAQDVPANAAIDAGRSVSRYSIELAPGESKTVRFEFLADADTAQNTASGTRHAGSNAVTAALLNPLRTEVSPRGAGFAGVEEKSRPIRKSSVGAFVTPMTQEVSLSTLSVTCNGVLH